MSPPAPRPSLPRAGSRRSSARRPTKLKVGVLLPRSGLLAQLGQSCQRGADIAPEVLKEMYGVDLELMNVDTESNVDLARTRAEKLINDGAQRAGRRLSIQRRQPRPSRRSPSSARCPFVINIAAAPQITEQGYKFMFRNFPTGGRPVRNGLALCRDLFQATSDRAAHRVLMHVNDTFGVAEQARASTRMFPTLNYLPFKLVDTIAYDPAGARPVGRGRQGQGHRAPTSCCWSAG